MDKQDVMPDGLLRSDPSAPGLIRRRCGRGFRYLDAAGLAVSEPEVLARVEGLVIPPAWKDVWICVEPNGHIQAAGTDVAGRRQYRYHDEWRRSRDADKHDRALGLGRRMGTAREQIQLRLGEPGLGPERVLAGAVRMLDIGMFRVGGEEYAPDDGDEDGTFGLATLRREHVRLRRGAVIFSYPAKGAVPRTLELRDQPVHRLVNSLLRRRGGGEDLLVYRNGSDWHDVRAEDLNAAVKEVLGHRYTAKDLRTWNATVLAAVLLARAVTDGVPLSERARKRTVSAAVKEVSAHLGNTPAVARSSYIDPRVVERFEEGRTILPALRRAGFPDLSDDGGRARVEGSVVRLLREG
ncbi:DNA topoisomerase IB [Pseudonocardia sp.]|uniref:DNA topoisomerase IB n=1 Tax=Pseudonocardia sp. TaxID=60912 RepID=UPI002609536B|nr:DNA topoisomerase IB [Pseudonocardia sp.]